MAVLLNEGTQAVERARDLIRQDAVARRHPALAVTDRLWRSFAQVALFGLFALVGVLTTLVIVPGLRLLIRCPRRRRALARRGLEGFLLFFTGLMQTLRLIRLEFIGREHLNHRGALIVANHPTLIDAFFLLSRIRDLVPIAKRALMVNPFTSSAIRLADYIVTADGPALVDACLARLAAGETLLLFPEGTRTAADGEIRFRRGAAHIAVRSGRLVVPVIVTVTERFLTRDTRWWLAPKLLPMFRYVALAPIDPAPFVAASASSSLAARHLTEHLRQLYSKELIAHGSV